MPLVDGFVIETGASLTGARQSCADLSGARLVYADLTDVNAWPR